MQQTKPLFVIKKYRQILTAVVIVEAVSYLVSLTDSLVAGNLIGSSALAAIGLVAPFSSVALFLTSIINSGTTLQYSYHVGRFDRKGSLEFFSQGIYLSLITGAVYVVLLFLFREPILTGLGASAEIEQYVREYFNIILLFYMMLPVSFVLDNMLIQDGDEKLSTLANVTSIVYNIVFSILFAGWWGVRGIAIASALSRFLFILTVSLHFFRKKNTLRLLPFWSGRNCLAIIQNGIVKASNYATEGILVYALNLFAVRYFDSDTLVLLVLVERFLGLTTLFLGLSMAAQPLIGTLKGEGNYKALRMMMVTVLTDMTKAGLLTTLVTIILAPLLVRAFGISSGSLLTEGTVAIRIVSSTLVFQALMVLFFIYYYLIGRQLLAFTVGLLKNLIVPLGLGMILALIVKNRIGLWIGLAAAPVLSMMICTLIVLPLRRQGDFPFLLSRKADDRTYIYCFNINKENSAALSKTASILLNEYPVCERTRFYLGLYAEEMLMLIREKNPDAKKLKAECTILIEERGVRMILRDSGVLFDITEDDTKDGTYQQFVVSNLMTVNENKTYLTTTGYNRTELFFPNIRKGMPEREITVTAAADQIKTVTDFINEYLEEVGCTERSRIQIDVAIDEIFGNITRYAYDPNTGTATVRIKTDDEPFCAVITFVDHGKPFNPLTSVRPDTSLPAKKRMIGGLGLYMVKKTMDDIFYRYQEGNNILTIRKCI